MTKAEHPFKNQNRIFFTFKIEIFINRNQHKENKKL